MPASPVPPVLAFTAAATRTWRLKLRACLLAPGAFCVVMFAGCGGGSGEGLDGNGRPIVPGSGGDGALTADFQAIQDHVFTPVCTVCHAGGAAPQGLRLDTANSYAMLVGISSNEASSVLRVAPGRPDDSYLVQKLEGRAAFGARMPLGGPYLDAATMATIRQWIADGALPSTSAADAAVARADQEEQP